MRSRIEATQTLTAVELDRGDTLEFVRRDGHVVSIVVRETGAEVLRTDLDELKVQQRGAVTEMRFRCVLEVEGEEVELVRELCTERAFYEPWEIAGVRIWFDAVDDLFEFMDETHGPCRPRKHVRLALQDASLRICPETVHPWCPLPVEGLDIRECYNGDDCWMGGYFGASAHGGLDINHPRGTPIWAPFDLDDQWFFNTKEEHGNNRWRGVRRWADGSEWVIQVHHVTRLHVDEHVPVRAGSHYADGAGVAVGMHDHSHFVFKVVRDGEAVLIDPWILFWQMYRDHPERTGACFYRRAETG
ncbi:MAG: hypothetical protein ACODAQ_07680, partial [Phycisphaeraceae bacterium]